MTRVAGTPPVVPTVASAATLDALEFSRALAAVAAHAVSGPGAAHVMARRPVAVLDVVRRDLTQVAEALVLGDAGQPLTPEVVEDIRDALDRLTRAGGIPDAVELVRLAAAGRSARSVARLLARLSGTAPTLALLRVDPVPAESVEAIERALEPDGHVRDGASREVDRARRAVRDTRAQLIQRLEQILRDIGPSAGEATVTLRDGRYVVPVARDGRGRVRGIVHGASGSGGTLFIEPEETVGLGNALAEAEAAEAHAVQALLRALAEGLRPHSAALEVGHAMCVAVDDVCARARYAAAVHASVPSTVAPPAALALMGVRHPLLLADGVDAVPFDLVLDAAQRALVVSGPNTGGKTVLLKAVGLVAALVQAGIVPPVGPGTVLPVFSRLVADVGDRQSIAESLSTFSAHLAVLREALAAAGPRTLVLLDEAGSGTDPAEGAALAASALRFLVDAGCRVVVTTHLGRLKELANESPAVVNGSLQFDGDRLEPTYRLLVGVPGRSYGLVMARRLAVPDAVVANAEARLSVGERRMDEILAELEAQRRVLDARAADLDAATAVLRRDAERVAVRERDLDGQETAVRLAERDGERRAREQARAYLLEARKRVEAALGQARAAVDEATAREARRLVEEGVRDEADALRQLEEATGWRVVRRGAGRGERDAVAASPAPALPASHASLDASTEVDLRGLRADEAQITLQQALDAAIVSDLPVLHVIHGKGTGVLRQVADEVLRTDRRVTAHRLAPPELGGAGVTIADLA